MSLRKQKNNNETIKLSNEDELSKHFKNRNIS